MKPHMYAELLPPLSPYEYDSLRGSLKEHGQSKPIVVFNDSILDGNHRYKLCKELDIDPMMELWDGTDAEALAFVMSELEGRMVTPVQKRDIIAKVRGMHPEMTTREIADVTGASQSMVARVTANESTDSSPERVNPVTGKKRPGVKPGTKREREATEESEHAKAMTGLQLETTEERLARTTLGRCTQCLEILDALKPTDMPDPHGFGETLSSHAARFLAHAALPSTALVVIEGECRTVHEPEPVSEADAKKARFAQAAAFSDPTNIIKAKHFKQSDRHAAKRKGMGAAAKATNDVRADHERLQAAA